MAGEKVTYSENFCEHCNKKFSLQDFFTHLITIHYYTELCQFLSLDPNDQPSDQIKLFNCIKCLKMFQLKKNLLIHYFNTHGLSQLIETHKRTLNLLKKSCEICNDQINHSKVDFDQHVLKTHFVHILEDLKAIPYPWMCICNVQLTNNESALIYH